MNYVNSIEASQSLDNIATTPEKTELPTDVLPNPIISEKKAIANVNELANKSPQAPQELIDELIHITPGPDPVNFMVEVVELTTSVKEILQFPEIEEIAESIKSSETSESQPQEDIVVEQIDLIREAKELPIAQKSKQSDRSENLKIVIADVCETNNQTTEDYYEEQQTYAKLEEIDLLSSIGRDIGVDLEKYVQPVPDLVAMEAVNVQSSRPLASLMKDAIRQDTNKLLDQDLPDVSSADTRKKEKMARNQARRRQQLSTTQHRRPDKRRADHIVDNGLGNLFMKLIICINL